MDNQWDSVSWNKTGQKQKGVSKSQQMNRALRTGAVQVEKKQTMGANRQGGTHLNTLHLDEDHENLKHASVTMELRKVIMQERGKAKMTQKDLATRINVKPQIIQEYESGKAIPNPMMLQKMERAIKQSNPEFVLGTFTKAQKKKKPAKKTTTASANKTTTRRRF